MHTQARACSGVLLLACCGGVFQRLRFEPRPPPLKPQVFDFKLTHMRDDIAAIEASNNTLEATARHNGQLLALLEGLLGGLALPHGLLVTLESPGFDPHRCLHALACVALFCAPVVLLLHAFAARLCSCQSHALHPRLLSSTAAAPAATLDPRLPGTVAAGWQLHAARQRLAGDPAAPGALGPLLVTMRAVRDAQGQLDELAARWVSARRCCAPDDNDITEGAHD